MATNYERLPFGAFEPLLSKARLIASQEGIAVINGPPGGYGFRRGDWIVEKDGTRYVLFASIPHGADVLSQNEMVRQKAAFAFAIRDLRASGYEENRD